MFVQFWNVGLTSASPLPMTAGDVSNHLLADWIPSLPVTLGSAFIGWPPFLLETTQFEGYDALTVSASAGRSERQWKSVLSWMLGVAGTRQFLTADQYRWIAPLSAFYPDVVQPVDLTLWNPTFPPGVLTAIRPQGSRTRLRPDYVALRSSHGTDVFDWALVESKGTSKCLTNLGACPPPWRRQARNAEIRVNGTPQIVARHLVVATRVNPNGARTPTRRLQVRAWNSAAQAESLEPTAALDVVSAHLFGLFKNLRMPANARAIAVAPWRRRMTHLGDRIQSVRHRLSDIEETASVELRERSRQIKDPVDDQPVLRVAIDSEFGPIYVELGQSLIRLVQRLQNTSDFGDAANAMRQADVEIDSWMQRRADRVDPERKIAVLPFGIQIRLPEGFEPRRREE